MKELPCTWNNVNDPTGYLFSFAKSLSTAVKNSPCSEFSEDIIATSGFAFRMWVAADLCPSAMSIWEFRKQEPWVMNGGLTCKYVERLWNEDIIEESRRNDAIEIIKQSVDAGIPAISWDIGVPEWGLITGYDDESQMLSTLSVTGGTEKLPYEKLGKGEIPILSVLTITGKSEKNQDEIISGTIKLAASHLRGDEWCENAKGLAAYPALIAHFEEKFTEPTWNMEYYLGTYAALKHYAYLFFQKYNLSEYAALYEKISENWLEAFKIKTTRDISIETHRNTIASLLTEAYDYERKALALFQEA